jgi:hypothetical protein
MLEIISALVALIPLILLIFQEVFSAQARARARNEKFTLDQAQLKLIVDTALNHWLQGNAQASKDAGSAWDEADKK